MEHSFYPGRSLQVRLAGGGLILPTLLSLLLDFAAQLSPP